MNDIKNRIKFVNKLLDKNSNITSKQLEELADYMLRGTPNFNTKKKRNDEYPILTRSQLKYRYKREISFSHLNNTQRMQIGLPYKSDE